VTGVEVESSDHVGRIVLENPDKRNAITPSMLPEFSTAIADLRGEVRCLVLAGAGEEAFSAGFDLSSVEADSFHEEHEPVYEETLRSLADFPYPTIAKVNGDAVGGGFDLSLTCDLRVAVSGARFGVPTARIGIVYSERAIRGMVQALGPARTKELLFTADLVDAAEAADMGIVNAVVEADEIDDYTADLASRIAGNAPRSLTASKQIVETVLDSDRPSPTERAHLEQLRAEAFESDDFEEGLAATAEGREPEFTDE